MTRTRTAALAIAVLAIGAQFIRFDVPDAPAGGRDIPAPAEVHTLLDRACYDCHSNHTDWPWYTHVAPLSWLLQRDVRNGRQRLNFSQWDEYASDPETARHKLEQIAAAVAGGDMAPWYYRALHPQARLTSAQRDLLVRWTSAPQQPPG